MTEPVAGPWHIRLLEPLRERLQSWPALLPSQPGDTIRPLAIGTDRALVELLVAPDDDGVKLIKTTLRRYCMTDQYSAAMNREGAMRHALDGSPVEPVPESHRRHRQPVQPKPTASAETITTTEEIMVTVDGIYSTRCMPRHCTNTENLGR